MSNFKPNSMLLNALNSENRDRKKLISALIGYINGDPYFETPAFSEAYKYLISKGVTKEELFEDFDPSLDYIEDESEWTSDYYALSLVFLTDNFCINRINHVQKVGAKLRPKRPAVVTVKPPVAKPEQPTKDESNEWKSLRDNPISNFIIGKPKPKTTNPNRDLANNTQKISQRPKKGDNK